MARKFFYVCAGLLCLALAYHWGASRATAQVPNNPVVGVTFDSYHTIDLVLTANGDAYATSDGGREWSHMGNVFSTPTSLGQSSWGRLKVIYR